MVDFTASYGKLIHPPQKFLGPRPASVRSHTARDLIKAFVKSRRFVGLPDGGDLWVILSYCEQANLPYALEARPGVSYTVRLNPAVAVFEIPEPKP